MIIYIDRTTKEKKQEKVYGDRSLLFLYGKSRLAPLCVKLLSQNALFSSLYGWWQRRFWTKSKIVPFIRKYEVKVEEFQKSPAEFRSFDDFFTRKLKPETRPIHAREKTLIIPADGRYLFYQDISQCDGFVVKGKKFSLPSLIQDPSKAAQFKEGSMVIARLCPADYHRFHFPYDCTPSTPRPIPGPLFSVNPCALKKNINIFSENKRAVTVLSSKEIGNFLFIEIGATCVGSIHQTFTPEKPVKKGEEKGYFSFGGSSLILLFEKDCIHFDEDLIEASKQHIEILCHMGQSMARALR